MAGWPASFRFHLAMDTLAFGCNLPTIRAAWGLAPVRLRSCWANKKGTGPEGSVPIRIQKLQLFHTNLVRSYHDFFRRRRESIRLLFLVYLSHSHRSTVRDRHTGEAS